MEHLGFAIADCKGFIEQLLTSPSLLVLTELLSILTGYNMPIALPM